MKRIILIFTLITFSCFAQNKELNKLFFDIPLHSSRDSIYNFCDNAVFITKEKNKYRVTKSGVEIKTFSGFHNKVETVDIKLDSIQFQLSTGTISVQGKEGYKNQLVFFLDYVINNKKYSLKKYDELKKQISSITKVEPYGGLNSNENKIITGRTDHWNLENDIDIDLEYEIINRKKYTIRISYYRME